MKVVLLALICYLIGCINPAYIIGKIKGFDIRSKGSMNAGASNVVINVGKRAGVATALFDIFKAFFCVKMSGVLLGDMPTAVVFCSVCCVLGHIFPFYLKFKGGKGFASLGGLVLGFNFKVFFLMLACAILLVLAIDYLCIITTLTCVSFPVTYGTMTGDYIGGLILLGLGLIIISKHIPNFKRIKLGTEARFSGMWHRDEEEERIRQNLAKQGEEDLNIFKNE
ncbi:MAG: glycerol-3-phosphate acyltransferase [Lachnospiraceae bacterium]|nr:glycerol-3-phosphate acyltransferase [Lachnospiraceae bacterium]